jgi:ABC-type glutathione transport system ATPase component
MPAEPLPLLRVDNLCLELASGVTLLRNCCLQVGQGEILAIVGESGSGKTQLLLSLLGLSPPGARASGSVLLNTTQLIGASEPQLQAIRGQQVALLFQDPMTAFNPYLRVGVQLLEALRSQQISAPEATARVKAALRQVGLENADLHFRQYPHQLSGGMRQRALLAMALLARPALLLADEPTTSLDVTTQAAILDLLLSIRQQQAMAILLVTHDLGVVARVADRVAVMQQGVIVEQGEVAALFEAPQHAYTLQLLAAARRLESPAVTA